MSKRTNILSAFFNSASDANEFLEAAKQEKIERDFQNWVENNKGELIVLDSVNEMCFQSLSPNAFEMWEKVKDELIANRSKLKLYDYKG
jgi:hypothetical protein